MKEVTKEEFYNTLGQLDVVIKAIGYFPHSSEFRLRDGLLMGKIVKTFTDGIIPCYFKVLHKKRIINLIKTHNYGST